MYQTRAILIKDQAARQQAANWLNNAPDGVELVIREPVKQRSKDANAFCWAGMLRDYEEQGWLNGRAFSKAVWHEFLKQQFLPDEPEDGITLKGYKKWAESPSGQMIMVGSTAKLTKKGFREYLERCFAFGAEELGIKFHVSREY